LPTNSRFNRYRTLDPDPETSHKGFIAFADYTPEDPPQEEAGSSTQIQPSADPEPEHQTSTGTYVPAQPDYRRRPPPPPPSPPTLPMDEATIRAIVTTAVKSAQSGEEKALKTPDQKEFSRQAKHVDAFIKECETRFKVFPQTFNTHVKKAFYALSLMNNGVAKVWKDSYIDSREGKDLADTWDAFKASLKGSFADPGSQKHTMKTLQMIKQGKQSANEHNTRFKLLLSKAGIDPTQPYHRTLCPVSQQPPPPSDHLEWRTIQDAGRIYA